MIPFCPFLPSSICPYISRQSGIKIPTFSRSLALKCSIDLREKKKKKTTKSKKNQWAYNVEKVWWLIFWKSCEMGTMTGEWISLVHKSWTQKSFFKEDNGCWFELQLMMPSLWTNEFRGMRFLKAPNRYLQIWLKNVFFNCTQCLQLSTRTP